MYLKDDLYKIFKKQGRYTGVLIFASNSKDYLKEAVTSFVDNLFDWSESTKKVNFRVFTTEKGYPVETILEFLAFERKRAVDSPAKVVILHDAELLGIYADKVLKVIEEPNPDSLIILTSTNPYLILPTIRSRSFVFSEYLDEVPYLTTVKDKYLWFLTKDSFPTEEDVKAILGLGLGTVVEALMINSTRKDYLEIAKKTSALLKANIKMENVILYLLYNFWLLRGEENHG